MKIEVGNLKSKIITDNPQLLKRLQELYSFKIPGSEYTAAYKRRGWDGKKRFISAGGIFETGLLSSILADLIKIGCEPEIVYEKHTELELGSYEIPGITLYDFQKSLVVDALLLQRGVIKSPTGSGKTIIMAAIIRALWGRPMVILFRAKQLLVQTYKFLTEDCGIKNVGVAFGEGYDLQDIMLCTVQSIEKIMDSHLETAEVLMVDEAHEFANGNLTKAAIASFPNAIYRLGFTATPPIPPVSKYTLEGALGPVIEAKNTQDLIKDDKLTKPIVQFVRLKKETQQDVHMTYTQIYNDFIIESKQRNGKIVDIVEAAFSKNDQTKILILVRNINHINNLKNLLPYAECIQGEDDLSTRYSKINKFLKTNKSVLIATKIAQTGINIQEITHIINAAGYKSEIPTIQGLGRALRKHKSKDVVYYYDFSDPYKYLRKHSLERQRILADEGHKVLFI